MKNLIHAATGRRAARQFLTACVLLVPLLARANTITIQDVTFGAPVVTTDWSARIITSPDTALLYGRLRVPHGGFALPVGIHSLLLLDPEANNVSDFLTLNVSARVHGRQQVSLLFESDSARGFAAAVAALRQLPGTRSTHETAGLLDLSGLLDSGSLSIRLDSSPRAVPDHSSTLLLLGTSLLGFWLFAWRTKYSSARGLNQPTPRSTLTFPKFS
jgi:hypothetical protein